MRSRLWLFVLVGVVASFVDIGIVVAFGAESLLLADVVALALAAGVSYLLNRYLTFRGQPSARWVRRPSFFAATAAAAGVVDVVLLLALDRLGVGLLLAKVCAVGAAAVLRWIAYRRILFNEVRRELAQRVDRPDSDSRYRLSVVIPAFQEEALIGGTVRAISEELAAKLEPDTFEVLVVDDGSADQTARVAAEAGARVERLAENQGKGGALRAGVAAADGACVVFTDADLAYSQSLLIDVLDLVEQGWDVVVGSRRHDDTNTLVRAGRLRELGGRLINILTHIVLLGSFRDTQCGLKGFRGDVGKTIFERTRISGFAFDVELFLIAEQDRLSLTEIPVSVTNRSGSSVRIVGDTVQLLLNLFRIRYWAGAGRYRPDERQRAVLSARSSCPC